MAQPFRVVRGGVFVPDWGNGDRQDDEKIRIHWKFLSLTEQQSLLRAEDADSSFGYEAKVTASMISEIENLSIEDDEGVTEIKTGTQLVNEATLEKLALETWLFMRKQSAVNKKK